MERIFTFYTMQQWTGEQTPVFSLVIPEGLSPWDEEIKFMESGKQGTFYDHLKSLGCTDVAVQQYVMLSNG